MNNNPKNIKLQYSSCGDNDHYNHNHAFGTNWVDEYDQEWGWEAMEMDLMVNSHGDMLNRMYSKAHRIGPIRRRRNKRSMRKLLSFFEMAEEANEFKNG